MRTLTRLFRKNCLPLFIMPVLLLPVYSSAQATLTNHNTKGSKNWTVNQPFQRDVFIENKGQFSEEEKKAVGDNILYFTHKGNLNLYFTPKGLIFLYDSVYHTESPGSLSGDPDGGNNDKGEMKNVQVKHMFTKMEWVGCNKQLIANGCQLIAENETPDYFTYRNPIPFSSPLVGTEGIGSNLSIRANAWTKLIYKNIYDGIDVEFFYPGKVAQSSKEGDIEYNMVVHPGANPDLVKILYSGSSIALNKRNILINTGWDIITDHEPIATDANGNRVSVAFAVKENTVSFVEGRYDKNKTLIIDPWMTASTLGGTNHAYDLGYDYQGNVYIFGGGYKVSGDPIQLQKYNSRGTLLWTFSTNFFFNFSHFGDYDYGGMTVDHKTGTSYLCEGYNTTTGSNVVKVNSNGLFAASFTGNTKVGEMWRIGYDYCNNQLVILSGGDPTAQVDLLDTNVNTLQRKNILSLSLPQDQVLLGFDNAGQCYFVTSNRVGGPSPDSNMLCKSPLPSLNSLTYMVPDHHNFIEVSNVTYYPIWNLNPTLRVGFGFNGLAANTKFVITYDGGKMRKWNAASGIIEDSTTVNGTSYAWGGLDLDCGGNIYCGNYKSVSIYDSSMRSLGSIPLSDTVYAVLESPQGYIYACGNGFVSSIANNIYRPTPDSLYIVKTNSCTPCGGTATAILNGCNTTTLPISYLWSNSQTTQTATGLCPGSYSVTVTLGCIATFQDSVVIKKDTNIPKVTVSPGSDSICPGSGKTLFAGGAKNYSWAPSLGLSCINCPDPVASPTATTTYTVVGFDTSGCSDTARVTIHVFPKPHPSVSPYDSICLGSSVALSATGLSTYSWSPSIGLSCTTCPNPTANPTVTTTYFITCTDVNGCKGKDSVRVKVFPLPSLATNTPIDSICNGNSVSLFVSGASSYNWSPSSGLSCYNCPNPKATPSSNVTYKVIGTNSHGCPDSLLISVIVSPVPNVSVSPAKIICLGDSVTLMAKGGGTYHWSTGSDDSDITVKPTSNTTYSVTVDKGCLVSASTSVRVETPGLFACCDTTIFIDNSAILTANGSYRYKWTPPTGLNCDTCPIVTATPSVTTTYTIIGKDSAGCQTEQTITVVVDDLCEDFTVPNVFTPNGDGVNDVFEIKTHNLNKYSITIYNRWGREMYSSSDPNQYWNGITPDGEKASDGVYYWIITANCMESNYKKDGFVQLLR